MFVKKRPNVVGGVYISDLGISVGDGGVDLGILFSEDQIRESRSAGGSLRRFVDLGFIAIYPDRGIPLRMWEAPSIRSSPTLPSIPPLPTPGSVKESLEEVDARIAGTKSPKKSKKPKKASSKTRATKPQKKKKRRN